MQLRTRPYTSFQTKLAAIAAVVALGVAVAAPTHLAVAQPPTPPAGTSYRVDSIPAATRARASRGRGDTLWWVQPGAQFPCPCTDSSAVVTDSVVLLFTRDTVYRLDRGRRLAVSPKLFPMLRQVRTLLVDAIDTTARIPALGASGQRSPR